MLYSLLSTSKSAFVYSLLLRQVLWNTLDTNNFSFLLSNVSDFIFCFVLFFLILDDEEVYDTAVT